MMIRVSIQVDRGDARTILAVRAESIQRALEIAAERNPGCAAKVMFPLDPDTFFVRDAPSEAGPEAAEIAA